ncbi:MAG: hypothetical protein AAGC88_11545 [Bacteroidota bacterium]
MNRVLQIALFTILGIFAFGGVVAFGILFFARSYELPFLIALLACLGLVYWSIIGVSNANNAWKKELTAEIKEGKDVITSWEIDQASWATFLSEQKARLISIVKQIAIFATVVVFVICFFAMSRGDRSYLDAGLWSLLVAVVLGVLMGGVYGLFQVRLLRKLSKSSEGRIYFAKEAIMVNDLLIVFKQKLFQSISSAELLLDKSVPVISLTVKMKSGERSNYQEHFIPFPVGKENEAQKIIDYYLEKGKS